MKDYVYFIYWTVSTTYIVMRLLKFFRVDEMKYQMSRQGWNHAPQCLLTPEQVQEFVPIMNIDKVRGVSLF